MEEYHKMGEVGILTKDDKVELLFGEIVYMSPIGSKHAACVRRIDKLFQRLIDSSFIVSIQNPIEIGTQNEPEPDISILQPSLNFYEDRHPGPKDVLLIIEVADSSVFIDKNVKLPLYADAGIIEYWIVDLNESQIEVHQNPAKKAYKSRELFYSGEVIQIDSLNVSVKVEDILG